MSYVLFFPFQYSSAAHLDLESKLDYLRKGAGSITTLCMIVAFFSSFTLTSGISASMKKVLN